MLTLATSFDLKVETMNIQAKKKSYKIMNNHYTITLMVKMIYFFVFLMFQNALLAPDIIKVYVFLDR